MADQRAFDAVGTEVEYTESVRKFDAVGTETEYTELVRKFDIIGVMVEYSQAIQPHQDVFATPVITLFDSDLDSPYILEQYLEERMTGKRFKTRLPGGFTEFTATLQCSRQEAATWVLNYPFSRLVVSVGTEVLWEGRIEDILIRQEGVDVTAMGYWSSLWDEIFYDDSTYTTGSFDIAEVVQDILEAECPSIATDYSNVTTTGIDVVPATFDGREYAGAVIQSLLDKAADDEWYAAVWEDREFYLFQKSKATVDWRPFLDELESVELGWSVENLRNRVRVRYDESGVAVDTAWSEDADSHTRWNVWREEWLDAGSISQTAAESMRDKRLAADKYMQRVGNITVKDMIRDANGALLPVWKVRAGQVLHIPDLTPGYESLSLVEDPRTLYIVETEYDMDTGVVTIISESQERRI